MTNKKLTAAEEYLRDITDAKTGAEIVDVTVPSGKVFQFRKPSKFAAIFGMARLPVFAAGGAIKNWTEQGVMKGIQQNDPDMQKMIEATMKMVDRVLEHSVSPKLVIGQADPKKNEICYDQINDDDLSYLFKWVQAGGDESMMLETFPGGRGPGPMAGGNRTQRRHAAKSASRNKG
jgi:hypothetical protein